MTVTVNQKVTNPNFPTGGASGTTGTGNLVFSESPTINNAILTGTVNANVNLRTDTLANLLALAGGVSEIGYASDVDTLVKFNGVAGGAEVYGKYTDGTTLNFTITPANLANITNPASGVYIDCNNISYLIIKIDPAVVTNISNINIKLPYYVDIPSMQVILPQALQGLFQGNLTFTLGYQAAESVDAAYFPISSDGIADKPTFDMSVIALFEISFVSLGDSSWTRTARQCEGDFLVVNGMSLTPSMIGYESVGVNVSRALSVSGTVYNSGSVILPPGIWLLTGSAVFTTSANLVATSIMAGAGLALAGSNPSILASALKVQIQSNLAGGTSYTLGMTPKIIITETQVIKYGNATATFSAGTVSANVYMTAIRLG